MVDQQSPVQTAAAARIRAMVGTARTSLAATIQLLIQAGVDLHTMLRVLEVLTADMQQARLLSSEQLQNLEVTDRFANFLACRALSPATRAYLGLPSAPGDEQQTYILAGVLADNLQEPELGRLQVTLLYDVPQPAEASLDGVSDLPVADAAQDANDEIDMNELAELTESIIAGTCEPELNLLHDLLTATPLEPDALDVVRTTVCKILKMTRDTAMRVQQLTAVRDMIQRVSGL